MSTFLIPAETLSQIRNGSLDTLIGKVSKALFDPAAKDLFSESKPKEHLATFKDRAVVLSEDGVINHVMYSLDNQGEVVLLRSDRADAKAYSTDKIDDYVMSEAKSYVDLWMSGRFKDASSKLLSIAPQVDERRGISSEKILEGVKLYISSDRAWKKQLSEKRKEFQKVAGQPLTEEKTVGPKFGSLLEGAKTAVELEVYRNLVASDLTYLQESVDKLVTSVESSISSFRSVESKLRKLDESVPVFAELSSDYIGDLKGLNRALNDSLRMFGRVDHLAEVHDLVADKLEDYKLAGQFIQTMSRRLVEASVEENSK